MQMYSPQKLHPISYILSLITAIKDNFMFIIIFLIFQIDSFDFSDLKNYVWPGILIILFVMSFLRRSVEIFRTRYWIENEYFVLTSGLFNLERKELNIKRIQSVDITQNIVHQLVGGVKLTIKTPSDGINLDMVTKQQSVWIQQEIEKTKRQIEETETVETVDEHTHFEDANSNSVQHEDIHVYQLSLKNLLLMSMTSGALFVTLLTILPILSALSDVIPWDKIFSQVNGFVAHITIASVIVIFAILFIAYIAGVLMNMIRFYQFTLIRNGDFLKVKYGLFNVKTMTLPISRIQAIEEKKSFIRHMLGYTEYAFMITSDMDLDTEDDTITGRITVLPFIKQKEAQTLISSLVPNMAFHQVEKGMPWRGFHRRFWILSLILISIIWAFNDYLWTWIWIPTVIIIAYLVLHSWVTTLYSGAYFSKDEAAVRKVTGFGFRTTYFKKDKVLGYQESAHPFMRRANLTHFRFILASGSINKEVGLNFEDKNKAKAYNHWYLGGAIVYHGKNE